MDTKEQTLAVVLSGGGCQTFWSLGALQRLHLALPSITQMAGVSAGSAMAAAFVSGRVRETMEYFCARTAVNRSNVYPLHLLSGKRVFPQEEIYRQTILHGLGEGGFEDLKAAPPLKILLAYLVNGASPISTIFKATRAYRARRQNRILHGPVTTSRGLETEVATAQDCGTKEELCDIILASSCTPPITAIQTIDGRYYADGALVDHAPVRALDSTARRGKILVFSTMAIPRHALPVVENRLYFAPSRELPISIWDYASPEKVRQTFDRGYEDAESFLRPLEAFLENGR